MSRSSKFLTALFVFAATATTVFAQDVPPEAKAAGATFGVMMIFYWILVILFIVGAWKVFSKAGRPGWAILIPFYNVIVMLQVAKRPLWWFFLYLIPFVNIVIAIIVALDIAKNFGRGAGFGLGLVFLPVIFYPILGFGSSQYMEASTAEVITEAPPETDTE